mgnify:CR=1 FL=1
MATEEKEKEKEALRTLLEIMPLLKDLKNELQEIKRKFKIISYYKDFRLKIDQPSLIPIEEAEKFTLFMNDSRTLLLKFKKSFNENDLPEKLNDSFMDIFLGITKKCLSTDKHKVVYIGKTGSLAWRKPVNYVVEHWEKLGNIQRITYSQHCYDTIKSYFNLIGLIDQFEKQVTKVL